MNKVDLKYIIFEITPECNLLCRYCYNHWKRPGESDSRKNSYKAARKVLKNLFSVANVDSVTMTGGEPFLSERFAELVLFCRQKKKNVTIITNGNKAKPEDYDIMINLGVNLFELPLHSFNSETHDYMTGVKGSWQKSVNSIKYLLGQQAHVVADIVVCKQNYQDIEKTALFLQEIGINRIMLTRFNIGGRGIGEIDNLVTTRRELYEAFKSADRAVDKYGLSITSNVCTPFCVLDPNEFKNIRITSCSAEMRRMPTTMDIEGNLRICNHSPEIMGNIFKDKLEDIMASDYVKNWKEVVPELCMDCKLWTSCYGGCRAASEQTGAGLSSPDPIIALK